MTDNKLKVKRHSFSREKYDQELLMDCVYFSEDSRKVTLGKPFCYNFHGIFIQNSGKAQISIDNEAFSLNEGCFIFLRANQVREWVEVTSNFSGFLLIFENEFIETFFNDDLFIHRFQYFESSLPAVLKCEDKFLSETVYSCKRLTAELKNLQDDSHHYLRSLLYTLLIQINRKYIKKYNLSTKLYQDNVSLRFRKLLEENIRKKQSVKDYAHLLNISRSQLNKSIQSTSGKTASNVIRERLLIEIKRELLYSSKNISEIAYGLGFSDNSNFVRFYKTHTGQTPSGFRRDQKK